MQLFGSRLIVAVPAAQNPRDTTAAQTQVPGRFPYHRHGWRVIVGAVVWLIVVSYVLWLGTRLVRALERFVEKYRGGGP